MEIQFARYTQSKALFKSENLKVDKVTINSKNKTNQQTTNTIELTKSV